MNSLSFSDDSKVRKIGNEVFENSLITSLTLPSKLIELSDDWCKGADHLNEVNIDSNNKYYYSSKENFLFFIYDDRYEILFAPRNFEGIYLIENGITRVCNSSFQNVRSIRKLISQSSSLEFIGSFSFYKCESLQKVQLFRGQELKIDKFCFAESNSLSSIEIECKTLSIGENCFENCKSLSIIDFKNNLDKITLNSRAFKGCDSLEIFVLNKLNEVEIRKECFKEIPNLKSIAIISKSISLGEKFIQNCKLLSYVKIECENDLTISSNTFDCCQNLNTISLCSSSLLKLKNNSFLDKSELSTIELSGKTVEISPKCFENCTSLTIFFIKNSGKIKIDENQFQNCNNLSRIVIQSTKTIGPDNDSKIEINDNGFSGAINLNCFEVVGGDIILNNKHFENCSLLEKIFVENALNIVLENRCFFEAPKIKKVEISGKNVSIKQSCFENCSSITDLILKNSDNINLGRRSFYNCSNLKGQIDFTSTKNLNIDDSCFIGTIIKQVKLKSENVVIGNESFKNIQSITSFSINSLGATKLGYNCLEKCEKLTKFNAVATNEFHAGNYCFNGANKLVDVVIDSKKVSFDDFCFYNCSKLALVNLPSANETTYFSNTFTGCYKNMKFEPENLPNRHIIETETENSQYCILI